MSEPDAFLDEMCVTKYYAQFQRWNGEWRSTLDGPYDTAHEARERCRELLKRAGYSDVGLRVLKFHQHTTTEVLDEATR